MELMKGFKETEIGALPEDWALKSFSELFEFSGGYSASREQLSVNGYCYLHYGDIHGSSKTYLDIDVDYLDIPKLNIPLKKVSSKSLLKDGDVVFVDASEDDAGTSKHIVILNESNIPFISGLHTIVAKSKTDDLVRDYKKYCFQSSAIRSQFLFYAVGTKVSGISKSNIAKLLVPVPPYAEQLKIAEALTDLDALLDSLDRLIVKKRELKEATVQKLLTGQLRLPGFSENWEEKRLGELLAYEQPTNYLVKTDVYDAKFEVPVLTAGKTFLLGFTNETDGIFKNIPTIIFDDFTTASKYVDFPFKAKSSAMKMLKPKSKDINVKFIYEIMQLSNFQVGEHKRHWISEFQKIEIKVPSELEQNAITAALLDIDAELLALVSRREKTLSIKQGMMQELLTGRTRLI
jgi:type I restriction enzyme S subunit